MVFRAKSHINPKFCKVKNMSPEMKTYEPVYYQVQLKDSYGSFGNKLLSPVHCQVFLSTYMATNDELRK